MGIITKPHSPIAEGYNKSDPLAQGLVFLVAPGGGNWMRELTTGAMPYYVGATGEPGAIVPSSRAWGFPDYNTAGISWPIPQGVLDIGKDLTISYRNVIDSMETWGAFVSIPARNGSWTAPFAALTFLRNYTSSNAARLSFAYNTSSSPRFGATGNTYLVLDGLEHDYTVVRDTASVDFFRDGEHYQNTSTGTEAVHWNEAYEVCLNVRSTTSINEATQGQVPLVAIWNRCLTAGEVAEWYANPYRILHPRKTIIGLVPSSAVTGTLVGDLTSLITGDISGSHTHAVGTLVGDMTSQITGDISGYMVPSGTLVGDLTSLITGSISGSHTHAVGTLVADLTSQITGDFSGSFTDSVSGTLVGDLTNQITGDISGSHTHAIGTLIADLTSQITGDISGSFASGVTGTLVGDLTDQITGSISGSHTHAVGTLTGDLTSLITGTASGTVVNPVTGTLVGDLTSQITGVMAGSFSQPVTGTLVADLTSLISGLFEGIGPATTGGGSTLSAKESRKAKKRRKKQEKSKIIAEVLQKKSEEQKKRAAQPSDTKQKQTFTKDIADVPPAKIKVEKQPESLEFKPFIPESRLKQDLLIPGEASGFLKRAIEREQAEKRFIEETELAIQAYEQEILADDEQVIVLYLQKRKEMVRIYLESKLTTGV